MAAPSGTVWGGVVSAGTTKQARIGIYTNVTNTSDTATSVNVQVWFWSKYGCEDVTNTLYYNTGTSVTSASTSVGAISVKHSVNTGDGWSASNQTKVYEKTYTYTRGTSAVTYKVYSKLTGIEYVSYSSVMYANTSYTVPALPSYTISYNANGGSGAPSSQTKWYDKTLKLSSTKPTRTGYTFQGWATSASGSVVYAAGANYTANAKTTLYAVWKANTYIVKYNANGGSGAPSSQTKTYGKTLTLSTTKPTRTNYTFLGWATSASATTATYAAGGSYTTNAAITLYAVWELAYVKPRIYSLTANRCNSSGTLTDEGTCALIVFTWETDATVFSITIDWESTSGGSGSTTVTASGTSGTVSQNVGDSALSAESSYTITVTVADSTDSSNAVTTLGGSIFPFDAKAGGDGVSFGKPAELGADESLGGKGVAEFAFDVKFNEPVYGNVLGLNKLPAIPANSELNDYLTTGCWAIHSNATAATITCGGKLLGTDDTVPPARACRFEVSSSTGGGIKKEQWSYLRHRFIPYNDANATWERDVARGEDNVWHYYNWWKSSLTPAASKKVYHDQKILWEGGMYMTAGHTANLAEAVSEQANGIVLVFSGYASGAKEDSYFQSFYIPKSFVAKHPGVGHVFHLETTVQSTVASKYLYINDQTITGNDGNTLTGTGANSGIVYANNRFVLRYVYGV